MTDDEAKTEYPNAGRASGYVEQGIPIGEDLVNRVTSIVASAQTQIILASRQMRELSERQDGRFSYFLNEMTALTTKEDARHDTYSAELKAMQAGIGALLTASEENARGQKKLTEQLEESVKDRAGIHKKIDALDATVKEKIEVLDATVKQIASYLDPDVTPEQMRSERAVYVEMILRHEQELKELGELTRALRNKVAGDGER